MKPDPSKVDPKHLKVSYGSPGDGMSRRDLIFGLLKPRYEIIPAVEVERCSGWRGCSLCLASCPQEAISLQGQTASIDKDQCTGCGACLPSCPNEAITSPPLEPEVLDASLRELLAQAEDDLEPKLLLITTDESAEFISSVRESLPPRWGELKLPCIGALSPWLVLRAFDLGADGIAVVPCGPDCRRRCQPERWQRSIRLVRMLLDQLGMEAERLRIFSWEGQEPQTLRILFETFVAQLGTMAPARPRHGRERDHGLSLIGLMRDLWRELNVDNGAITGDEIPFGFLTVQAAQSECTLCGACRDRCPTGAVALCEQGGVSRLLFDHSRCVACKACVKVCPEQVLQMEKVLDFARLGATTVLAEDRMVSCRECGKEIAPLSMMRRVRQQLKMTKDSASATLLEFCPDCRIFGRLDLKREGPS